MSLTFIEDYEELMSDMLKVLETEDTVYVDAYKIKNISHASIIANDLDLSFNYNVVDTRYYFHKKLLSV